jgi:hypothetical protein
MVRVDKSICTLILHIALSRMARPVSKSSALLLLLPLLLLSIAMQRIQASTEEEFDPFHEGQDL